MIGFLLALAVVLLLGALVAAGPARAGAGTVQDRDAERFRADLAALATRVGHHR
ncbi:hypothetical protein [Nocardia harenae]|uniref:hypothetical protein n=1 Tax=Nocardia harenae TaxID=358707 RepID=UPI000A7E1D29|nr:hypothetical protein [Nocardia harenae]